MEISDLGLKFKAMTPGNTPKTLYLHHTGGIRTFEEYHQQHLDNGWSGIGYNLGVDLQGKKYKLRSPEFVPAGIQGHNQDSLHIVCIGNFENMIMPDAQKKSLLELIAEVKNEYKTLTDCKGHGQVAATDCPGKNYPLADAIASFIRGDAEIFRPQPDPESPIHERIFKLQHLLNLYGYTDKYGNRLDEDGWIGELTLSALAKLDVKRGDLGEFVKWIQERLGITVDGVYGKSPWHETWDAIRKFQADHGLIVDGWVGINTWTELVK